MEAVSYSYLRENLRDVMNTVSDEHAPVIITRKTGENMVLLSLSEYNAMKETAYRLSGPKNAQRLHCSLANASNGVLVSRELID